MWNSSKGRNGTGDSRQEEIQCPPEIEHALCVAEIDPPLRTYYNKVTANEIQHLWPWEEISPFMLAHPSSFTSYMSSSSSKYFTFLSIGSPYYLSSNVKLASFPLSLILFCYCCWQKLSFSTSPHQYQKLSRLCKTRQAPCHNILVISSVANDVLTSHVLLILHPRPTPTHHNFMSLPCNHYNIEPGKYWPHVT